jgi:tetratricopeptide (TPR) repeat protein
MKKGGKKESSSSIGSRDKSAAKKFNPEKKIERARALYNSGRYQEALSASDSLYEVDAFRTDNLLLLGCIHFQLRNYSESIFYNQQCIRVDPGIFPHSKLSQNLDNQFLTKSPHVLDCFFYSVWRSIW